MSSISTLPSDALSNPLVSSLNKLVARLGLPFELDTPLDLTPSLLLAIIESLLETRLPIAPQVRESRDHSSKVAAMKIFLGVLEHDVIKQDVGLSDIDPRRLAAGYWEETVFIGELLCWLGKQMGFLRSSRSSSSLSSDPPPERNFVRQPSSHDDSSQLYSSPAPHISSNAYSFSNEFSQVDDTTPLNASDIYSDSHFRLQDSEGRRSQPTCIHEVTDPSFLNISHHYADELLGREPSGTTQSLCNCDDRSDHTSSSLSSIKYDGYMEIADEEAEMQAFERTRAIPSRPQLGAAIPSPSTQQSSKHRLLTKHNSPTQHTLALLNERARLLSELAALDLERYR